MIRLEPRKVISGVFLLAAKLHGIGKDSATELKMKRDQQP
jgi:hypothetical protein